MSSEPDFELIAQKIAEWEALYDKKGLCNRCGKCCYFYDPDIKNRIVCSSLEFDDEGLAVCKVYGTEKYPEICAKFPQFEDPDPYWIGCSYYWETKS
jgi:uncharacterized cysteine cluster protein YcgN (CxxCxxCC family)